MTGTFGWPAPTCTNGIPIGAPSQNVPKSGCSLLVDPTLDTHAADRACTG